MCAVAFPWEAIIFWGSPNSPNEMRDICRKIGLNHVADLPKKGFGMPPEFLAQNTEELTLRAKNALYFLNSSKMIPINNFGKKLSIFAGSNMNSLWATIVLGEWCASFESSV